MSKPLTVSLNQLANLIGALGNPNPDDDSEPHGPGGPVIRGVAQARFVALAVVGWAVKLGELGEVTRARMIGKGPPTNKSDGDPECLDMIGKGPPTEVVERMIAPRIQRFADDYCGTTGPIRLPIPIRWPWPWPGPGPDPWQLVIASEHDRLLGLLVTGAQFQFAAAATQPGALSDLFAETARTLLKRAVDGFERGAGK